MKKFKATTLLLVLSLSLVSSSSFAGPDDDDIPNQGGENCTTHWVLSWEWPFLEQVTICTDANPA